MSFTFNPERHEYRLDGVRLPSVTEILHVAGMLPDYSFVEEFYSERGKAVHAAIALDLRGELDEGTVDEEVRPYLDRARKALPLMDIHGVAGAEIETPRHCSGVAGTPDLRFPAKRIIDWKCGEVEPGHVLQVAGYRWLCEDSLARIYLVSLAVDPPKIRCVAHPEIFQAGITWMAALRTHRFREAHGLLPKNPITEVSHDGADIP